MNCKEQLDSHAIEARCHKTWNDSNIYKWDPSKSREETFAIDTPPPTISGELHMGHIFSYTQTDFIARFQRMNGKSVFYPIGFDNNGLPTERLVEKIRQVKAKDLIKKDFIENCNSIIVDIKNQFRQIYKSLGLSFDWTQEYETISYNSKKISQLSFIHLLNQGKVVRKYGPSFWDIQDQTAISQAENVNKERIGILNDIKFSTIDNKEIIIATTRPEMIPACVAIFYHPNDCRYSHLKNSKAIVPFFHNIVPILSDQFVDQKKGTGLVMCSTFGDVEDIECWRKHNLHTIDCIKLDGTMKNAGFLNTLNIRDARKCIIEKLKSCNLLLNQKQVIRNIKCAERSGEVLEIIPTHQWYVKILPYKKELHTNNNVCNWYPGFMKERLNNWISGLNQDWCISRQRYFGIPFPVWYSKRTGEEGKILVADVKNLPVDPSIDLPYGYDRKEVIAEKDVMDTWATSSLNPQILCQNVQDGSAFTKNIYNKLFPFDLRPQSHEIIRTWTFYSLVKSLFHYNIAPWKNLMISGWCLTTDKKKMSKSHGKTINPIKVIKEHGADVVRYWASSAKLGVDTIYSDQILKTGKKLLNKLWNAGKFINFHIDNNYNKISYLKNDIANHDIFCDLDLWILSCLYETIKNSTQSFQQYEYCDAKTYIEDFFWKYFCDNYLELVKTRVYNTEHSKERKSALLTLNYTFNTILKLFAPFIPHITEELNNIIYTKNQELINQTGMWPKLKNFYFSNDRLSIGTQVLVILELVRKYKSINNLSLKSKINTVYFSGIPLPRLALLDLKNASNCSIIEHKKKIQQPTLHSSCGQYSLMIS